jgi:branched-chain amino acid transport system ATP-binding protein
VSVLRVVDLRVRIDGSHILQGVSFEVPPVGVTALLGRNGVGKSTTLRALLGLMPANAVVRGEARLRERPVLGVPTYRLIRAGLAYVPEDRCVFAGLTVGENLKLAERRGEPADYDAVYALFPELSRRTAQRAGTLSGGQQQMVAIARVLLHPAELLFIDEPTKGLAPKVVTEVADVLARVAERTPILLVEQNLAVVRRLAAAQAGGCVVLAAGQVAYTGPVAELLGDAGRTTALLGVGQAHHRGAAA